MNDTFHSLKYSFAGFLVVLLVSLGGFTLFNFAQGQWVEYQDRRTESYNRSVTGNELFGFQSATVGKNQDDVIKTDWFPDQDIPFEFCREPIARIIAFQNFRTYFLLEDGSEKQSGERKLPDEILYQRTDDPCQDLDLFGENTPNNPGKYKFCQEFSFDYFGFPKVVDFCSTEFLIKER